MSSPETGPNPLPVDAILISANRKTVCVRDAVDHLASHEKLYWEVGFPIKEHFSYPLFAFIHIGGGQLEYRAMVSDIIPYSRNHYGNGRLAEQVKPKSWRQDWRDDRNDIRSHDWKHALVMTEIVPFSHDTCSFRKPDGELVQHPPEGYYHVLPPSHPMPMKTRA